MHENSQDVNSTSDASTSDGISRPNGMTREQWLHAVLYSGRVSRVGQHLALVLYHLADTTTNIAKLSARDLERITGWGRTAIIEHLNELHRLGEFLLVTWGRGRAKSTFELQGIIAEAMAAKRAERDAATTADTNRSVREDDANADAKADASGSVREADTQPATKAAKTSFDRPSVHEADTNVQKSPVGGTIGGENNYQQDSLSHSLTARSRAVPAAPDWMISEDGGFEGQVFELTGVEIGALQTTYGYLDFPADLVAVDQFLAREFFRLEARPSEKDRLARMHTYLAKRNREVRELRLSLGLMAGKEPRKPAKQAETAESPSCWYDNDVRLQVANGFKVEMLGVVGGDENRLREELDKAAGWVGVSVRGPQLIAKVRSRVNEQVKGRGQAKSVDAENNGTNKRDRYRQIIADELAKGAHS